MFRRWDGGQGGWVWWVLGRRAGEEDRESEGRAGWWVVGRHVASCRAMCGLCFRFRCENNGIPAEGYGQRSNMIRRGFQVSICWVWDRLKRAVESRKLSLEANAGIPRSVDGLDHTGGQKRKKWGCRLIICSCMCIFFFLEIWSLLAICFSWQPSMNSHFPLVSMELSSKVPKLPPAEGPALDSSRSMGLPSLENCAFSKRDISLRLEHNHPDSGPLKGCPKFSQADPGFALFVFFSDDWKRHFSFAPSYYIHNVYEYIYTHLHRWIQLSLEQCGLNCMGPLILGSFQKQILQ